MATIDNVCWVSCKYKATCNATAVRHLFAVHVHAKSSCLSTRDLVLQVARDLGTLWTTLQPPSECSPSDRHALLLEVASASAAAHAAWQAEEAIKSQVRYAWSHALLQLSCRCNATGVTGC